MMMWFGKRHPAPAYADTPQTETPLGAECVYCEEAIQMGDDGWIMGDGKAAHRECNLRMVVGSVAHQRKLCSCYGGKSDREQEEGMTRREGAKAALEWFERSAG